MAGSGNALASVGLGMELNHPPTVYYTHVPGYSACVCAIGAVRSSRMEIWWSHSVLFVYGSRNKA